MSYSEGHFYVKELLDTHLSLGPYHPPTHYFSQQPLAEFNVQFWSLFHEQEPPSLMNFYLIDNKSYFEMLLDNII